MGNDGTIGVIATATSSKYYIRIPLEQQEDKMFDNPLFVYDIYNNIWWCEDGAINSIANFSSGIDGVVMANWYEDIVSSKNIYNGYDHIYDVFTNSVKDIPIQYDFHTKVYGADGVDSLKSISRVWFQASANATVYLTDSWTSSDNWRRPLNDASLKEIGTLGQKGRKPMDGNYFQTYDQYEYEQQECIVPKMFGQKLNTFQIVVKGQGPAKFYLMKRDWNAK